MWLLIVLGLLLAGAVFGGAGMRRLGRWTGQAAGRWRPGAGIGALLLLFVGLVVAVRGQWVVGLPLLIGAAVLATVTRKRAAKPLAPKPDESMSEAEARALLGVGANATTAEVQAAYLRLIQRAHPDHGGTSGLARQLNAARARLVG
jgi:hypothetical protein